MANEIHILKHLERPSSPPVEGVVPPCSFENPMQGGDDAVVMEKMGIDVADAFAALVKDHGRRTRERRNDETLHLFSPQTAHRFATEIASTLVNLHSQGVSHNDLKPENVVFPHGVTGSDLVCPYGGTEQGRRLHLIDFGNGHILTPGQARFPVTIDDRNYYITPAYAPPEAFGRLEDANLPPSHFWAADAWGLGILIYLWAVEEPFSMHFVNDDIAFSWNDFVSRVYTTYVYDWEIKEAISKTMKQKLPLTIAHAERRVRDRRLLDVLKGLLRIDPLERMSCEEALRILLK